MFRLIRNPEAIKPSHIFLLFYTTAIITDLNGVSPGSFIVGALSIWVAITLTRLSFGLLLVASTVYFVLELPDTENHTNLFIFANMALLLGLLYSYRLQKRGGEDAFYAVAQPVTRVTVITALAIAGFHKFNADFINPDVSCVGIFAPTIAAIVGSADFAGVQLPPFAFLLVMAVGVSGLLWRQRPDLRFPAVDWAAILTTLALIVIAASLLATVVGGVGNYGPYQLIIFLLAVGVLCWQLIEVPLLLVPRMQWVALCFSLLVHVQLALMRIVDFQALAVALLITFVPAEVWQAWRRQACVSFGSFRVHRAHLYVLLNVLGAAGALAQALGLIAWPRLYTGWGLLFVAGLLVMLWPIISDLFSPARTWRWEGVSVFEGATPAWLYVVPLCLLLFGLTSHLGLRTAGNLSMYSNLRTEAGQNNHLLLGFHPIKLAGYQEDVVHIIDIGDAATIGPDLDRWGQLEGHLLPFVEFRKLLWKWREKGEVVTITFDYQGVVTRSPDITQDPQWQVEHWDWEMRLMDFRVIQAGEGPNACRW